MTPIVFIHLNRSGGRTIRNWIADHFDDPVVIDDAAGELAKQTFTKNTRQVVASIIDLRLDQALDAWDDLQYRYLAEPTPPTIITVIRDPINLFPSRQKNKRHGAMSKHGRDAVDAWVSHVLDGPNKIAFDYWVMDYRMYLPLLRSLAIYVHSPIRRDQQVLKRYRGFERKLTNWLSTSAIRLADGWFTYREKTLDLLRNPSYGDPEIPEEEYHVRCQVRVL